MTSGVTVKGVAGTLLRPLGNAKRCFNNGPTGRQKKTVWARNVAAGWAKQRHQNSALHGGRSPGPEGGTRRSASRSPPTRMINLAPKSPGARRRRVIVGWCC